MRPKKSGAPRKHPQGLTEVLFVRAAPDLLRAVDKRLKEEKARRPGVSLSRADVVRSLLWEALAGPKGRKQ